LPVFIKENEEDYIFIGVYRCMMIAAAMMVCLGHGSNDVANSISPLLIVFEIHYMKSKYAFFLGSAGIAVGLLLLGHRVIETVGKKVIKLDFPKGFSAQFATSISVIIGTVLGLPLSTTHCMIGSLFGIILANKSHIVQSIYSNGNV
jgi:phosphate/sulfate permease